jgi:DNA-binding beta-propeller fold protein YncE
MRPAIFLKLHILSFYFLSLFIITACTEKEGEKPPRYLLIDDNYQSNIEAGKVMSQTIQVQVVDADYVPKPNVNVIFKVHAGEVSLSALSSITDIEGYARVEVMFGSKTDNATVIASVFGLEGSPATFNFGVHASAPRVITIVSGNEREGYPGTQPGELLVVKLTDEFSNPVRDAQVRFQVSKGNGTVSSPFSRTTTEGIADIYFRYGDTENVNEIVASYGELKAVFRTYSTIQVKLNQPASVSDGIKLSWTKYVNPSFVSYAIFRSLESPQNFSSIAEIRDKNQNEFIDKTAAPGVVYSYYIKSATALNTVTSNLQTGETGKYVDIKQPAVSMDLVYDKVAKIIYQSNQNTRQIMMFSLTTLAKIDSIQLSESPVSIALSPDREKLYVTLFQKGSLAIVNLKNKSILKTINIASALGNNSIHDIYCSTTGQLFATSWGGFIAKIDETSGNAIRIASDFSFADSPGYFIDDDGKYLYAARLYGAQGTILKLAITEDEVPLIQAATVSLNTERTTLSQDGKWLYLTAGEKVSTENFSSGGFLGLLSEGAAYVSRDEQHYVTLQNDVMKFYDITTRKLIGQSPFRLGIHGVFVDRSASTAVVEVTKNSSYPFTRLYQIPIHN